MADGEVGALRVSLSLDGAQFTQSATDINRRIRALNSEFKAARAGTEGFDQSLEGLRMRSQNLSNVMNLQRQKVEQLRRQYEQSAEATGENSRETENLLIRYNNALTAMRRTETQLNAVNDQIAEQTSRLRQLQTNLQTTGQRMQDMGERATNVGQQLTTGLSLPIAAFGAASLKTAMDSEAAQGKIQAQLGVTAEEAEKLNEISRNLWKDGFGENVDEAAAAVTLVSRNMSDIPTDQLEKTTELALTLAEVYEQDLTSTTKTANQLMNQFGLSAEEAFDLMSTGFQQGLDYSGDFLDTINEYAPQFKALGFSSSEFFSTLKAGADAGAFNLDKVG